MCMSKIETMCRKPAQEIHIGYKYFDVFTYGADKGIYNIFQGNKVKSGVWVHDTNTKGISMSGLDSFKRFLDDGTIQFNRITRKYPPGFHIFTTKEGAEQADISGKLLKVKYKNVVAEGIDRRADCVIARSMMILPGQIKWR
jgi:hypothetical protein